MRIAQFTESLEIGGAERVVVSLANALGSRYESSVICVKKTGPLAENLAPSVGLACLHKPEGNQPSLPWRLARTLRSVSAEVVHTHDWGVFLDAVLAARLAGVRTVVHTVHGLYMAYPPGLVSSCKKRVRHWLERRVASGVAIVCVSDELRDHVHAEVGLALNGLHMVPNGIAVGSAPRRAGRGADGGFRFITVGRLAPVKNIGLLLEAFARVSAARADVRLTIVGDGPERSALERLAGELRVSERVEFTGFRSDVDGLLAGADAFVLSSRSEGIPMSILEAMRAGLPVIATRVGGVPSVVEHERSGLLVDDGDGAALAAAMETVAARPEAAAAMGAAGFERVRKHFSIEAMVTAYERLYGAGRPAASPTTAQHYGMRR